jgi:hypothetical protein
VPWRPVAAPHARAPVGQSAPPSRAPRPPSPPPSASTQRATHHSTPLPAPNTHTHTHTHAHVRTHARTRARPLASEKVYVQQIEQEGCQKGSAIRREASWVGYRSKECHELCLGHDPRLRHPQSGDAIRQSLCKKDEKGRDREASVTQERENSTRQCNCEWMSK